MGRDRLREMQAAFALLTRLPVGQLPSDVPTPAQSAWAFPLVGLFTGALSGIVFLAAATTLPGLPSALLALVSGVLMTGALHEDGLADVADGFGGGCDRAEKLRIMQDSRIGSYGVVALVLTLGLIASAQAQVTPSAQTLVLFATIGALSRAAMLVPMTLLEPARENGLGATATLPRNHCLWVGLVLPGIFALAVLPLMPVAALMGAAGLTFLARSQIGGQTGDVLGATQKVTETLCWLTAVAVLC